MSMAPSWPPTPSARKASTSPTTAPGAIIPWWSRWPTPASRSTWSIAAATAPRTSRPTSTSTRRSPCAGGPASERIYLRGDTDFSQTEYLDRWDGAGDVRFLFGIDANSALKARAEALPADAYSFLERPPKSTIKTAPRQRPEHVKAEIVREREFETIHTLRGDGRPSSTIARSPARRPIAWSCSASGWVSRRGACGCARSLLLLLHHQRSRHAGRRDRLQGERSV